MIKLLFRLLVAVVVIVIVVGVVGYFWMDSIAKAAVEEGGRYALGVDTSVDSVSLSLFGGSLQMKQLTVGNPEGFDGPHLMSTGAFDLELETGSVFSDTVVIKKFDLDGVDMHIEQKLKGSNISAIMDHIEQKFGGEGDADAEAEGKKVRADLITVRNVTAHVKVLGGREMTIKVPKIELKNVTGDNAAGVALPELIARIVPAILAAILERGQDLIPADLLNTLQADVSDVAKSLGGDVENMVKGVRGEIEKVGKDIGKGVGDAVGRILGGDKDANDANKPKNPAGGLLEGILGGKK